MQRFHSEGPAMHSKSIEKRLVAQAGPCCPSCGVLYEDHAGLIGTCAALSELRRERDQIEIEPYKSMVARIAKLSAERDHWKANCAEMTARNQLLRDRPDLTAQQVAERLGYYVENERMRQLVEAVRAADALPTVSATAESIRQILVDYDEAER